MTLLSSLIPAAVLVAAPLAHAQETSSKEAFVNFLEVEGQLEFSGVLCARPLQVAGAAERGQTADEVRQLQRIARRALEAYEGVQATEGRPLSASDEPPRARGSRGVRGRGRRRGPDRSR